MSNRLRSLSVLAIVVASASLSLAQVAPMSPGMPGPGPAGGPMTKVTLTTQTVERLLKAIPDVSKESTIQHEKMMKAMESGGDARPAPEDMKRMESLFTRHGFAPEDFAVQMSTLIATYMMLDPAALDAQIPNESTPQVKQALADPTLTPEQRQMIKDQLAQAQQSKEVLRGQFAQIATDENKKAVKPYMAQIKKVLADAQADAARVLSQRAGAMGDPGAGAGPRRKK
jgi:hypothetical protein